LRSRQTRSKQTLREIELINVLPTSPTTQPAAGNQAQQNPLAPALPTAQPQTFPKLDDWLRAKAKKIKEQNESRQAKIRAQVCIEMLRKFRGLTPYDRFGFWNKEGVWCESPMFDKLRGGAKIFQALIRGAEANFAMAHVQLDVKANKSDFNGLATEKVSRGLYEILDDLQWTESNQQALFYAMILKLNGYVISRMNGGRDDVTKPLPQFSPLNVEMGGKAVCQNCYGTSDYTSQSDMTCPDCGGDTHVLQDPEQSEHSVVPQFTQNAAGFPEIVVCDALDISVDENVDIPNDIETARYVEWREPVLKNELKRLYPQLKLESIPEWSYQRRLKEAYKRFVAGEYSPIGEADKDDYELRHIWLCPADYADYVSPGPFSLGNCSLNQNDKLIDKYSYGAVFGFVNSELAYIDGECKDHIIKAASWLTDGASHNGLGAYAGIQIQRKVDFLDNLAIEGEARSIRGSLLYNPNAVSSAHLEGQNSNIPLKQDFALPQGADLNSVVKEIEVSGLSEQSLGYLMGQIGVMQKVMGVPDVMLGTDETGDPTKGGQQLRSQNALGLLVPAKQSEAHLKEGWLKDQLRLVQEFWPVEAIAQFASFYGEEWLEDEIMAFKNADLSRAVRIRYTEGTEVPESRNQKQSKLRNDIAAGFIPPTPEILSDLAKQSGYDSIDVGNYQSNNAIARKRWNWVKEQVDQQGQAIEQAYQVNEAQMTDPATGQRAMDPMGNPLPNPVIQQFMTAPVLQPQKFSENHSQQMDFWKARQRELSASVSDSNPVLIAICDGMILRHLMITQELTAKGMLLDHLAQAPASMMGGLTQNAMQPPQEAQGAPPSNSSSAPAKTGS
jgi:hypothetical protein